MFADETIETSGQADDATLGEADPEVESQPAAQQAADDFALDQFAGLIEVVIDDRGRINTETVINRCEKLAGMNRIRQRR